MDNHNNHTKGKTIIYPVKICLIIALCVGLFVGISVNQLVFLYIIDLTIGNTELIKK